jgi:hypothetical protein
MRANGSSKPRSWRRRIEYEYVCKQNSLLGAAGFSWADVAERAKPREPEMPYKN